MRHAWMLLLPALVGLSTSAHHGHGQEKKEEKKEAPKTGKGTVYLSDVKMAYTWTIESESEGPLHSIFECDNPCQGKKHAKHEDCDLTCDGKCGAIHQHEPYILVESNDLKDVDEKGAKPKKGNDAQMGADFSSFGVAGAVTASETAREIFQGLVRDCGKKWDKPIKVDHFNKTPCSSQKASIHYRRWVVSIDYELLYTKKEGDKTTVEHGPKRKLWWEFTVEPSNDDDRTLTYADPVIDCRCEVKQTKNHDMSFDGWQDEYAHIGSGPDERPMTGGDLAKAVSSISVEDMNWANIGLTEAQGPPYVIPAGWELECLDGSGQNVQIQGSLRGYSWLFAGPAELLATQRVRVLCLDPHKPQPKPDMMYRLVPPKSRALARLAQMTEKESIRGFWDQTRLWIASAHASLDDIQKVLIPKPGARTYLEQLYVVFQAGALDPGDPEVQKIMELRLLTVDKAKSEAGAWLLGEKLRRDPDGTGAWLKEHAGEFRALFAGGDSGLPKYIAELAFTTALTPGGVNAARTLLTDCVPEEQREAVAKK